MDEHKVYVTIPDARAIHVHDGAEAELGRGELSLVRLARGLLGLTVGPAAFALDRATPFGTIADDTLAYVFQPARVPGHVRLVLPPGTPGALQDAFERALVRLGLLSAGLAAHTDELARAAEESALAAAARVGAAADAYVASHAATAAPVAVDASWHAAVDDAAARVHDAAHTTGAAADGVGARVQAGGAWLAQQTAPHRPAVARADTSIGSVSADTPGAPLSLRAAAAEYTTLAASLSASASALASAAGSAVSQAVGHDFGPDAARLVIGVGRGAMGAGRIVGDVGKATSVGWFAGQGALGALQERDPAVAREVRDEGRGMEAKMEAEVDAKA